MGSFYRDYDDFGEGGYVSCLRVNHLPSGECPYRHENAGNDRPGCL